jgi:hypothetical protein
LEGAGACDGEGCAAPDVCATASSPQSATQTINIAIFNART